MITREELIENGYRSFTSGDPDHVGGYQKTVLALDGTKKYFITFYEWDFSKYTTSEEVLDNNQFSVTVRMYVDDRTSFDLDYMVDKTSTLAQVEQFYFEAYARMGCCPDLHNN